MNNKSNKLLNLFNRTMPKTQQTEVINEQHPDTIDSGEESGDEDEVMAAPTPPAKKQKNGKQMVFDGDLI